MGPKKPLDVSPSIYARAAVSLENRRRGMRKGKDFWTSQHNDRAEGLLFAHGEANITNLVQAALLGLLTQSLTVVKI